MSTPPTRLRPSRTRPSTTEDFHLAELTGSLTITELPDGRPAEIFLVVGKQGSTLNGICEALSLMTSLALQYQVPVIEVVRRLVNMRFEPSGHTGVPDIPVATSLADYLGRRLAVDYLTDAERAELGIREGFHPAQAISARPVAVAALQPHTAQRGDALAAAARMA